MKYMVITIIVLLLVAGSLYFWFQDESINWDKVIPNFHQQTTTETTNTK